MKKNLKWTMSALLAVCLLAGSALSSHAETYFVINDIKFRERTEETIIFSGWENSSNADTLVIPEKIGDQTIVGIDPRALENNTQLRCVDLSQAVGLTYIGESGFQGCTSLESIEFPEALDYVASRAFRGCTSLAAVVYHSRPTCIYNYSFSGCTTLTEFEIPDSVTTIQKFAFENCTALERVVIPESVTAIAASAFSGADNVVIYCYSGSYAESFAISNEIPYVLLAPQYEIGDVNMNGQVEITDVTLLQQHLAEILTLSEDQLLLADMNQDGEADIGDATGIQFKIAGFLV